MTEHKKIITECFYADASELHSEDITKALDALPWNERKTKADRYMFEKDKRLCIVTGLLLRWMLERSGVSDLTLSYEKNGKPELANNDKSVYFNCSHSGRYAVCVISDSPVGVDIEQLSEVDERVTERVFTKEEKELISKDKNEFFRLWTRKESYLKLTSEGLSSSPETVNTLNLKNCIFTEYTLKDHCVTVCGKKCDSFSKISIETLLQTEKR